MSDMPRPANRGVIPILLVAAFVVILNETTMNVALTSIMADLGITERTAQWLTTAFMLTMAVVMPITGWLLDRLPTTRVFVLALSLFSLGTLACAVARVFASISDEADLLRDSDSDYHEKEMRAGHLVLGNGVAVGLTDPLNPDSDGDGLADGAELSVHTLDLTPGGSKLVFAKLTSHPPHARHRRGRSPGP